MNVMGFEVLMAINDSIWGGMPCDLVGSSTMFQWHLLYLQGRRSALTAAFFKNIDDCSPNYAALYAKHCSLNIHSYSNLRPQEGMTLSVTYCASKCVNI
jgi:hypothetical protein